MSAYFMFKHIRLITNIHDNFAVATQEKKQQHHWTYTPVTMKMQGSMEMI